MKITIEVLNAKLAGTLSSDGFSGSIVTEKPVEVTDDRPPKTDLEQIADLARQIVVISTELAALLGR